MNKFSKLAFTVAASTMLLSGCNSDEASVPKTSGTGGAFHATLTLSLPAGTRSATVEPGDDDPAKSDAGFEVGNDSENMVGSAIILLASYDSSSKTYSYITSNEANATASATTTDPVYSITFDTGALIEYAEKEIWVFAYCNPTTPLHSALKANKATFTDEKGNSVANKIADAESGFLMSNAAIHSVTLPSQELMENTYDKPEKAYDLGTVRVERATARFDFKETQYEGVKGKNRYPVKDVAGNTMAYVQLDGMALLNEAQEYYYLPRVSPDGFNTDVTICGQETPSNYVVSPNADKKTANQLDTKWLGENYSCTPIYQNIGSGETQTIGFDYTHLQYENLEGFTGLGEDKDDNWNAPNGLSKVGYHIWKYVTENTIPKFTHDEIANYQRKGVTTGVVFKGYLVAGEDTESKLASVINAGEKVIYAYGNVLYGDLDMLKKVVLANPVSSLAEVFKEAYDINDSEDGPSVEDQINAVTADLTSTTPGGLAIYRPTDGKYVMYYSYWNRHNDNGLNTQMRSMEFSVVRNNVYKLSVQDIVSFGHPGDPGDDPDPDEPDDPDETPKTYFKVEVQVIPWVVRVNHIVL